MLKLKSFLLKQAFSFNTSKKSPSKKRNYPLAQKSAKRFFLPKINKLTDLEKVLFKVKLIDLKTWKRNFASEVSEANTSKKISTTSTSTRHEENMNAICRKYK